MPAMTTFEVRRDGGLLGGRHGVLTIEGHRRETPLLYTSYSFVPTNPRPWDPAWRFIEDGLVPGRSDPHNVVFEVDALLLNFADIPTRASRDAIAAAGGLKQLVGYSGLALADTGGWIRERYHPYSGYETYDDYLEASRTHAHEVVDLQSLARVDLVTAPDVSLKPASVGKSIYSVSRRQKDIRQRYTFRALDEIGRSDLPVVPVISGHDFLFLRRSIDELLATEERLGRTFPVVALGGIEPITSWYVRNLNYRMVLVASLAYLTRRLLPDRCLHAFGVSSPLYITMLASVGFDTFESISWIQNARRFKLFDPRRGIEGSVNPGRRWAETVSGGESEGVATRFEWASLAGCRCPVCSHYGNDVETLKRLYQQSRALAFQARAVHNAWVCQAHARRLRNAVDADELADFCREIYDDVPTLRREGTNPNVFLDRFVRPVVEAELS
jgi:tRNA-guanine family transglycosylase